MSDGEEEPSVEGYTRLADEESDDDGDYVNMEQASVRDLLGESAANRQLARLEHDYRQTCDAEWQDTSDWRVDKILTWLEVRLSTLVDAQEEEQDAGLSPDCQASDVPKYARLEEAHIQQLKDLAKTITLNVSPEEEASMFKRFFG